MNLHLEHLPADAVGLEDASRRALAQGHHGGVAVARGLEEVPRPTDRHDPGVRALLAEEIGRGLAPFEPPGRALTSLEVLARPGAFCVVTGQQPGFLGGPLYSLYKALHACRLAGELSRSWGTPVVPVFWNHADDHDVAEVNHAWVLNRNLDLQRVGLAGVSSGRLPISRLVLEDEEHRLGATRALLRGLWEEHAGVDAALDLFHPRGGETLAGAFTRILTELAGEHGLVVVEPDWIRTTLSRALAEIVVRDPVAPLVAGSGSSPTIDPLEAALVYHVDDLGRRALRAGGEGFRYDGEEGSRSADELAAEIVDAPEAWSAGALLRPLVQDAVFPTCATVGGWGELAYHGQLGELRDACDLPRPPLVPRASCTIVEPEVRAGLAKIGTTVAAVLAAGGHFAPDEGAGGAGAPPVVAALEAELDDLERRLLAHKGDVAAVEPALGTGLERAVRQARGAVEKVVAKVDRVHRNRLGKGERTLRRLNHLLVPRSMPQERVLGPLGFTARWGRGWVEALYDELPPAGTEHLVVHLEEGA